MKFVFDERKAAEAAAHLMEMAGGTMPYLVLIKLLYLADRRAVVERGFPITGDRMVSMDHGPVLSRIYDGMKGNVGAATKAWQRFVSPPKNNDVQLLEAPPSAGRLSNYEIDILRAVHEKYGHVDKWDLRDLTHHLPEWHDPHGSSSPIDPEEILRSEGKTKDEIAWRSELAESIYAVDQNQRS